jgi:tRNA A-37 threonylcarbamoyl transferase component Bud32
VADPDLETHDRSGDGMTPGHAIDIDGVRWTRTPVGFEVLSDDDLRLNKHIAAGRATIVKTGEHRTVYRVELARETVYWKECRLYGPRAWWRDFLRGPKAKLEFDRARALAARGIATVEPLAWGRMGGFWPPASFLITRALGDTAPLDDYLLLHPLPAPAVRRRLTEALAAFVAKLHDAGVTHPDLHPGNLLVRATGGHPEFFLIDVHDIQLSSSLGGAARRSNLAVLNRWFQIRATRTDRLRFWRAYGGPGTSSDDGDEIERDTERSVADLWASREERCLRASRHFQKVSGSGVSGFAVRELAPATLDRFLSNPDEPFDWPGVALLKDSRSATVCMLSVETSDGPRPMVYKRFKVTEVTDPFANLVRDSGALRSWKAGHAFIDRGLPTPRPVMVLHRRRFGLPTVGYLLCEQITDARHLDVAIRSASRSEKWWLGETLARWVRVMHERGVSNRDLKAANILVTAAGEYQFIDLVGVRVRRNVKRRIRVRDLARLNASFVASPEVTRTDRLRFLRIYLLWGRRGSAGWKDWWRQVARETSNKVRKNTLRNRPLG